MKKSTRAQAAFTLMEIMLIGIIISILGIVSYTNWVSVNQKQKLSNTAIEIQTIIDTVRTQSVAVAADRNGNYPNWGLYINFSNNRYIYGPYDLASFSTSSGELTQKQTPPEIKFVRPTTFGTSENLLITFSKKTGTTLIFKVTDSGVLNNVTTSQPFIIELNSPNHRQTVEILPGGNTESSTPQNI